MFALHLTRFSPGRAERQGLSLIVSRKIYVPTLQTNQRRRSALSTALRPILCSLSCSGKTQAIWNSSYIHLFSSIVCFFLSFFFADEFNLQPSFLGSPLNYTGGLIACSGAKKQTMFPQRALLGDAVAQRRCLTLSRFAVSRPSCTLSSTLSDFIAGLFHTAQAPCNKHAHVGSGYTGTLLHTSTHTQTHICACACIPSPLASLREWPLA